MKSGALNFDPDPALTDFAREAMDTLAGDCRAAAVEEAEPPAMQRANDLPILNPASAERAVGVGTTPGEYIDLVVKAVDRQSQSVNLQRQSTTICQFIDSASTQPLRHHFPSRR